MSPRPAPDLNLRRDQVIRAARDLAEVDGWAAVTMRRLAAELGVTQPVLYSAFAGRQALIDAVALNGFDGLAAALEAADVSPMARMRAYLGFAVAHPRVYEAMFSLPSGLAFAVDDAPEPLQRAFRGIRDAFPDADGTRAEVAWSTWHGLATLQASGRLRASAAQARLDLVHEMLTYPTDHDKEIPMTTTQEVFDRHMSHQLDRDLDAILADYAPDAIVVGPDGIGSGHDHIRAAYEQVLPLIGALDVTSLQVQGEVVYVSFRAHSDGPDDLVGTDTFVIRDGLIHVHTFYATTAAAAKPRFVLVRFLGMYRGHCRCR